MLLLEICNDWFDFLHSTFPPPVVWKMQEPEIEYIEGYDELEEEDDMEDFDGLAIDHSHADDDNGKTDSMYFRLIVLIEFDIFNSCLHLFLLYGCIWMQHSQLVKNPCFFCLVTAYQFSEL